VIGNAVPIPESLEGAAVAEDYSNQLAVRHQVRQVLLAALARVGIWGKADRVKVVAYGFRQDGDFVLLLPHVTMSHKPLHRHSSSEIWCWAGRRCQAWPGRNVGQHPAATTYCNFKNIAFEKGSVLVPCA
jgi:hypothetical protein